MSKPDFSIDTIENQDNSYLNKKLDKIAEKILPQEKEVIGNSNNDQVISDNELIEKFLNLKNHQLIKTKLMAVPLMRL